MYEGFGREIRRHHAGGCRPLHWRLLVLLCGRQCKASCRQFAAGGEHIVSGEGAGREGGEGRRSGRCGRQGREGSAGKGEGRSGQGKGKEGRQESVFAAGHDLGGKARRINRGREGGWAVPHRQGLDRECRQAARERRAAGHIAHGQRSGASQRIEGRHGSSRCAADARVQRRRHPAGCSGDGEPRLRA